MKIYLGISTYNRKDLLERCLNSLKSSRHLIDTLVVVDNGQQGIVNDDISIQIVNQTNLGYTGGTNQILRLAKSNAADWCLILNDDITVVPDFMEKLVPLLELCKDKWLLTPDWEWACIAFSKEGIKNLEFTEGQWLDEQFWPGYYSDNDLHYRIKCTGKESKVYVGSIPELTPWIKDKSKTKELAPELNHLQAEGLYIKKWGGLPGKEIYAINHKKEESTIYFCSPPWRHETPDGSTIVLLERYKALQKAGIKSVYVTDDYIKENFPNIYGKTGIEIINFAQLKNQYKPHDLFITSWDEIIIKLVQELNVSISRCILYAQSYVWNSLFRVIDLPVITISEHCKEHISKITDRNDIMVIPNGIAFKSLLPLQNVDKVHDAVCTVRKRHTDVLDLLERNTSKFPIVELGGKTHYEHIKEIATYKFLLNVHREEGFGLPPLEAMSVGTVPIIVFKHGALAYANETNCIGLNDDPLLTLKQLENLTEEQYTILQQNGMETAKRFDIDTSNLLFVNTIKGLL